MSAIEKKKLNSTVRYV